MKFEKRYVQLLRTFSQAKNWTNCKIYSSQIRFPLHPPKSTKFAAPIWSTFRHPWHCDFVVTHYLTEISFYNSILWHYATDLALKFVKFSFPDKCKLIMSHKQLISTTVDSIVTTTFKDLPWFIINTYYLSALTNISVQGCKYNISDLS